MVSHVDISYIEIVDQPEDINNFVVDEYFI